MAAFYEGVPVGHVEAGLRSGHPCNPFPEEMNRRLITRLATYHFAATPHNRAVLLSEGVAPERIFVTGNPVVDALQAILRIESAGPQLLDVLARTEGLKRIALTTHRRESFGEVMGDNLKVLRDFVAATRRPGPLVVPELRDLEETAAPGAEAGSGAVDEAGSTGEP